MSRRCRRRFSRFLWSVFPHLSLVSCLLLYSLAGAPLFQWLEGSAEAGQSQAEELLGKLWNVSRSGGDWTFLSSLFFCCTVITTVGYGNLTPITVPGRVACMIYAAVGIPLMLLVLADLGGILAGFLSKTFEYFLESWHRRVQRQSNTPPKFATFPRGPHKSSTQSTLDSRLSVREPLNLTEVLKSQATVKRRYMQMRNIDIFELIVMKENRNELPYKCPFKKCHSCPDLDIKPTSDSVIFNFDNLGEEVDRLDVPVLLIVLIVVAYIMLGAVILPLWEDWDTLEAFYFCFVTLTTIGFGDVFPAHPNYFLLLSLYTVVGMAIICMAFKLMQNRMVGLYKQCIICVSRGNVQMTPAKSQS
uniref:Potassium channel domain-containing protein n=1 Tax=Pyxicephalus adspersus TaxID=30357 RepID=A0AAV2ZKR5_PYXAD|nr:TPA: hypothetical protein GDO54_004047 [Pyxicephalus adspersus]